MLCSPVYPFFPYNHVNSIELGVCFSSVYCYDVHKLAEAPPEERYRARQEFGNYLLQYYDLLNIVMEKHIVDPDNTSAAPIGSFYKKVCGVVNFPHFVAFMEIALCWFREVPPCPCKYHYITFTFFLISINYNYSLFLDKGNEFDLGNVIVDELCYFTFAYGFGNTNPLLGLLKTEASKSLNVIITEHPEMLSRVIGFAAQHMGELQSSYFTARLEAARPALAKFVPDSSTAACIAALIARTQPPPLGMRLPVLAPSRPTYEGALNKYIFSPPVVQLPQGPNAECIVAGCKLLEVIDWRLASATLRMHMAVILLSARKFVSEAWYASFLSDSQERGIFAAPFDMEYIRAVLALTPKQFVVPDDVILLHVRILLSLLTGMRGDARFTMAWLVGSGFFAHLGYLLSRGRAAPVVAALCELWPAFLADTDPGAYQAIGPLFARLAAAPGQDASRQAIALLGKTVACDPAKSVELWARLIMPHALRNEACMSYLDILLYYAFTAQDAPLVSLTALQSIFYPAGLDPATTLARARTAAGTPCVWVAYAAALCGDPNPARKREALLHVGMSHQNDATSALVWAQFFEVAFAADETADVPPLPQELRDRATKFFVDTAKTPAITADPDLRKFYISLASWDRVAILTGPRFASEVLPVVRRLRPSVLSTFKPKPIAGVGAGVPAAQKALLESGGQGDKGEKIVDIDGIANEGAEKAATAASKSFFALLSGMSTEERAEALRGMLPQLEDEGAAEGGESAAVDSIQRDMRRTLDDFAACIKAHESEGIVKQIEAFSELTIFKALKDGLERYAKIARQASEKEAEHLELLRRMCANSTRTVAIPVSCRCGHAPPTVALQITSGAPDPEASAQLRANSAARAALVNAFVEAARTVAYVLHLLGAIAGDPDTARTTGVCIFFGLLPLVLTKQFPQNSPPTSDAAGILLSIGRKYILGSLEMQRVLHKFLLYVKMDGKYPSVTPVTLDKSSYPQPAPQTKSQIPQQRVCAPQAKPQVPQQPQQPQQTQQRKMPVFTESYKTMFALYEPCVFINNDDPRSKVFYFNCLHDVYKARNMNDEAKRELLKRFEIKKALPSILRDKEAASKLTEFFKKYASRPVLTGFFTEYCVALITTPAAATSVETVLNALVNFGSSESELVIARQTVADPAVLDSPGFDAAGLLSEWVPGRLTLPLAPRFCALDVAAVLVTRCAPGKPLKRALRKVVATALDGCGGPTDLPIAERVFAFIGAAAAAAGDAETAAQALRLVWKIAVPRLNAIGIGAEAVSRTLMARIPGEVKRDMWRGWKRSMLEKFALALREAGPSGAVARCVCLDFAAAVNWEAYLAHLEDAATAASEKKGVAALGLAVVRFGAAALAVQDSVEVGRRIAARQTNWRALVRGSDLAETFCGTFFVDFATALFASNAAYAGERRSEVSFAEALRWLAVVAETVGSGPAVAGVAQEALAVSFMATMAEGGWECRLVAPLAEVDRILLDVQLGLCQYLAGSSSIDAGDDSLETVVRCVFTYCAPTEKDLRIVYGTAGAAVTKKKRDEGEAVTSSFITRYEVDESYFDEDEEADADYDRKKDKHLSTFTKTINVVTTPQPPAAPKLTPTEALVGELRRHATEKDIGLVLQFPKQSVPGVALKFVTIAGSSFSSDLRLCVTILEESIRAYFTLAEASGEGASNASSSSSSSSGVSMAQVSRALVPPASARDFFAACVEARAALTACALVEQLCAHGKEAEALELVARSISRFAPHQTYQADIVALWVSGLGLAEDPEWVPERQEELAPLRQIARHLREFGAPAMGSSSSTLSALSKRRKEGEAFEEAHKRLYLAARAAHILYLRVALAKSEAIAAAAPVTESVVESSLIGFKADEEELVAAIQQLKKAGDAKENKKYKAFFGLVPGFRNQDYSVRKFKHDIAETLFPMEPYLKNI